MINDGFWMYLLFNLHFVACLLYLIENRKILLHCYLKYVTGSIHFITMRVLNHCFDYFLAEIFSSGKVHIWTRCEITGADNFSYCCSCRSFLCLCCQKTDGWFFWPLGDIHNGCCCCVHSLCESFSLVYDIFFLCMSFNCVGNLLWLESLEAFLYIQPLTLDWSELIWLICQWNTAYF